MSRPRWLTAIGLQMTLPETNAPSSRTSVSNKVKTVCSQCVDSSKGEVLSHWPFIISTSNQPTNALIEVFFDSYTENSVSNESKPLGVSLS
jgi:hypothetical protein